MLKLILAALLAAATCAHAQSLTYASPMAARGTAGLNAANNLDDLASAAAARTNLGLGTMSVQNSSAVAITGGSVSGTPIGTPVPASVAVTTLTHSGAEFDQTVSLVAPTTGGAVSLPPGTTIINPVAALLALGITLPSCSAAVNGEIVRFVTTKAVAAVTLSSIAGAVVGTLTTLLGGGASGFICYGAGPAWYRLY